MRKRKRRIREQLIDYEPDLIDILETPEKQLVEKVFNLDIIFIKPIATGKLTYGNKENYEHLRDQLFITKPTKEAIAYLKNRSIEEYNNALHFYHIFDDRADTKAGYYSLISLSFCCSYYYSVIAYQKSERILTIDDIIQMNDSVALREIRAYEKIIHYKKGVINKEIISQYLQNVENLLKAI